MTASVGSTRECCQRKRGYRSSRAAKKVAKRTMARGGPALVTYRCEHCRLWHNGHLPPWAVAS